MQIQSNIKPLASPYSLGITNIKANQTSNKVFFISENPTDNNILFHTSHFIHEIILHASKAIFYFRKRTVFICHDIK